MLLDLNEIDQELSLEGEICIVGGGAVGLTMAARLARAGQRVVVLEGGGASLERRSQDLHRGASVGHPLQNVNVGRYRVLGGSTVFWGGQVVPVDAHTLQKRPWIAECSWPIDTDTLSPYFAECYRLLGLTDVELNDDRIWQQLGISARLDPSLEILLTRWVPQRNFSKLFREEINKNPNLTVIVHANVTGFAMDETRQRVARVEARSLSGRKVSLKPHSTVLAGGSLEIARLLLHLCTEGGALPWHTNRWLGRGFYDHLHGDVGEVKVLDHDAFHRLFDTIYVGGFKYYPRIRLATGVQSANETVDVSGEFRFDSKYTQHIDNIRMFLNSLRDGRRPESIGRLPGYLLSVAGISAPLVWRYLRHGRSYKPRRASVRLVVSSEQIPVPDSHVRLGDQIDPTGMHRIVVDWRIDGRELRSLRIFTRNVGEVLSAQGLARLTMDSDLEEGNPAFLAKLTDGIHQMGTARMGHDAYGGVVDRNLLVFGTKNLYVAGQAVFPLSGFANPTFTGIALGLRLCDHLTSQSR